MHSDTIRRGNLTRPPKSRTQRSGNRTVAEPRSRPTSRLHTIPRIAEARTQRSAVETSGPSPAVTRFSADDSACSGAEGPVRAERARIDRTLAQNERRTPAAPKRPGMRAPPADSKIPDATSVSSGISVVHLAETGGFEPPVEFNPDPSLAVKSVRPLRHVSIREQREPFYRTEAAQRKSTARRARSGPARRPFCRPSRPRCSLGGP